MRSLRREYDNLKSIHDRCRINCDNEKRKIAEDYERKLSESTTPNRAIQEHQRENELLKKKLEAQEKKI